eukprot:31461-Pelagococcus_subviridis.AAC.5
MGSTCDTLRPNFRARACTFALCKSAAAMTFPRSMTSKNATRESMYRRASRFTASTFASSSSLDAIDWFDRVRRMRSFPAFFFSSAAFFAAASALAASLAALNSPSSSDGVGDALLRTEIIRFKLAIDFTALSFVLAPCFAREMAGFSSGFLPSEAENDAADAFLDDSSIRGVIRVHTPGSTLSRRSLNSSVVCSRLYTAAEASFICFSDASAVSLLMRVRFSSRYCPLSSFASPLRAANSCLSMFFPPAESALVIASSFSFASSSSSSLCLATR